MKSVGIYTRTSTTDQHCEVQESELRTFCAARGWAISEVYTDHGYSGAKASRPALDRLMADARRRKIDTVAVVKLDRFGRSLLHCVGAIQELQALGVRFVAVTQGLDTDQSNPASTLLMHILAAVASFEREIIRERVNAGIKHARAKGKRLGRPSRVFDRQRARDLRAGGMSFRAIAKELGVGLGHVQRAVKG